jgi:hypothetical protein
MALGPHTQASPESLPTTAAVARLLAGLVVLMAVLGPINVLVTDVQLFAIDTELKAGLNLMVLVSGAVLFVAAALALQVARSDLAGSPTSWNLMAFLFAFIGVDELVTIHEHLEVSAGISWQLIYLPVTLAGAAVWWVLFIRLRARDGLLAAGWVTAAGCWAFAQFLEALFWVANVGHTVAGVEKAIPAAEELSELIGSSLFLLVTLALLESGRRLRYRAPPPSGVARRRAARDPASPAPSASGPP